MLPASTMLSALSMFVASLAPPSFALVIGSNPGGLCQQTLHFAEDDARTMAHTTHLKGYDPARVRLLLTPSREWVPAVLDDLEGAITRSERAAGPSRRLLNHSGHARAAAWVLGGQQPRFSYLPAAMAHLVRPSHLASHVAGVGLRAYQSWLEELLTLYVHAGGGIAVKSMRYESKLIGTGPLFVLGSHIMPWEHVGSVLKGAVTLAATGRPYPSLNLGLRGKL